MNLVYEKRQVVLPEPGDRVVSVRVWDVPKDYMNDGFFISAHGPGEYPQAPACSGADAALIAEMTISGEEVDVGFLAKGARVEA